METSKSTNPRTEQTSVNRTISQGSLGDYTLFGGYLGYYAGKISGIGLGYVAPAVAGWVCGDYVGEKMHLGLVLGSAVNIVGSIGAFAVMREITVPVLKHAGAVGGALAGSIAGTGLGVGKMGLEFILEKNLREDSASRD